MDTQGSGTASAEDQPLAKAQCLVLARSGYQLAKAMLAI